MCRGSALWRHKKGYMLYKIFFFHRKLLFNLRGIIVSLSWPRPRAFPLKMIAPASYQRNGLLLTNDVHRGFLKKATCWPPPVFMILIIFGEVALAPIHTTHILYKHRDDQYGCDLIVTCSLRLARASPDG